jgi:flagellar hook-associated protein 1 FlgK
MSSGLFAALTTTANSMDVLEQAMGVIQNNVANSSTPGYATQSLNLEARAFSPTGDLWGGVASAGLDDSRNQFAEQAVWNQNEALGQATQSATSLSALQSVFNVTGSGGIPGALSNLFAAFSAWSNNPNDGPSQTQVLNAAQGVAQAFNTAASNINQLSSQTGQQLQSTVAQINALTSQIAQLNNDIRQGDQNDPGLQAQLYNDLEQLSNLTSITIQTESDGTVTVMMAGQTPLVTGGTIATLSVAFNPSGGGNPNAPPDAQILSSTGQDVTSIAQGASGQLGALLEFRNVTIPSVIGNGAQQGSLNQLAQEIADQVNTLLEGGETSTGAAGIPLFTYAASLPTGVASTLALNPTITAPQLAAIQPGPPQVANGIADQLSQLANAQVPALNNMTYTDFYSSVAAAIGNQQASAASAQQVQSQLLSQAESARSQLEGVSLNNQAAQLLQFQQGYEAAAQMITVINQTTQYLMQMMQQSQV